MPTNVNVSAITVGITVGTPSMATRVYVEPITVGVTVGGVYIPPTAEPVPTGQAIAPVLLSQQIMPHQRSLTVVPLRS